jgi:chromosome partitioning protein
MTEVPRGSSGVWNPPSPAPSSGGRGPVQRIMFASQKGGVAKTASAVNVAVALGQMGLRTLLVDTDPIGSVAACFGITVPPGHPGIYGVDNWEVADLAIPSVTQHLDVMPYSQDGRAVDLPILEQCLTQLSARVQGQYDYLVIDTRPSVADMARRLCQIVDQVVVVFQCQPLAYRTLGGILGQLRQARADGAPARLAGLLLTMVDPADPLQGELERHIRANLGQAMLPLSIPLDREVGEGLLVDRPIVVFNPNSPVARAYRQLAELLVSNVVSQPR